VRRALRRAGSGVARPRARGRRVRSAAAKRLRLSGIPAWKRRRRRLRPAP
jgi:hypothetical protein